jgi:hypothetical protein
MEITRSRDKCFDDVANYLITMIALTLTTELYVQGYASRYAPNDRAILETKQVGKRLVIYPHTLLDEMYANRWPTRLIVEEEPIQIPTSATLNLGIFERQFLALERSMFINYFEHQRPHIDAKHHGDTTRWPAEWNFARIVRNALAHNDEVVFSNLQAVPVNWHGLTYSPADNGRKILHSDLWPADLIYLLRELDTYLS